MDTVGLTERRKAEDEVRLAADAAHASYYAHPSLHMSSYKSRDGAHKAGPDAEPMNPAYHEIVREQEAAREASNKLAKEEAIQDEERKGGAESAFKLGGQAGGTTSGPGPSATVMDAAKMASAGQLNGVTVNGAIMPGDTPDKILQHYNVSMAMEPHLQLMCGPLLSYHTIENGMWHGAAMVVTADQGSILNPAPFLSLAFAPYGSVPIGSFGNPSAQLLPQQMIPAQHLFTYNDKDGPCSFFRFMLAIPVQDVEMTVAYRLNNGAPLHFVVPARGQNLRWAAHSCNGFSSGVDPDEFKGKFPSGYDPVWEDLLSGHRQAPYHALVGGGDQIYCDGLIREPELQSWINAPDRKAKLGHPLTDEMKFALDRFYFNHYCKIFRSNAFGRANATIPMVNMLDDHDLIDGFGTYDDETQAAPVFSYVGGRGYFWFLLFQLFTVDAVDGTNYPLGSHPIKSMVIGGPGAWIPYPSHSLAVYMGPNVRLYALDCRAERKLRQVASPQSYQLMFHYIQTLPAEVEQLVILLGVPIAYPRMSFLEHFLDKKWNPINILARRNALGLGGMVNKFNQASELLDDLNDHWCANVHKKERNWLVMECQRAALESHLRVTFLSGDVHLAAVGCLFTYKRKLAPANDYRYMLNVVSSAIVNTPPPAGAAKMVGMLSGNKHRTLHKHQTDERMLPLFENDTDGKKLPKPFTLPRRNYASVQYLPSGDLQFDIRVEKWQGAGETVGYPVLAPPPRWEPHNPAQPSTPLPQPRA